MKMKRKNIWLTTSQVRRLKEAAEEDSLCPSQVIRLFINAGLKRRKS